jgi:hypothetical protein
LTLTKLRENLKGMGFPKLVSGDEFVFCKIEGYGLSRHESFKNQSCSRSSFAAIGAGNAGAGAKK